MAVAELGVGAAPARRPKRLGRRVGALIGAQLIVAAGLCLLAYSRGTSFGRISVVAVLALAFAITGSFGMSLEFHRHRFTFTLAEAVLAVGLFAPRPLRPPGAGAGGAGGEKGGPRPAAL